MFLPSPYIKDAEIESARISEELTEVNIGFEEKFRNIPLSIILAERLSFDDVTLTSDTIHYQVKEELDSTFIDDTGNQAYRIERSRRNDTASFWTITDIWYCNLTSSTAEKVEENLRFIKLSFPMFKNKTWAGNKYIHPWDVTDYLNGWNYSRRTRKKYLNSKLK